MRDHKLLKLGAAAFLALFVAATAAEAKKPSEEKDPSKTYKLGLSVKIVNNTWEALFEQSFAWWVTDKGHKAITNHAKADPALQLTQCRQMLNSGVDGLVVAAQDADAAAPIVDMAAEKGVPVITADADINHPGVKLYVGFSGVRAGELLGQQIIDHLRNNVKPIGEVSGQILEIQGPLGGASARDRSLGFKEVLKKYPKVKIVKVVGDFQEEPAKRATEAVLRKGKTFHAVFSANGPMAIGAVEAMKSLSIDPTKIFVATVDATPSVIDKIKKGQINVALDQPAAFYNPIAAHYLLEYLKKGDVGLPKVGDTVTAKDITLSTGVKHAGVEMWNNSSAWAPAKVVKGPNGHPWLQTNAILVTRENADSGYLWANVKLPGRS